MLRFITMLLLLSISCEVYSADIKSKLQAILDRYPDLPVVTEVSSGSLDVSQDLYHVAFAVNKLTGLLVYFVREKNDGSIEIMESVEVSGTNTRALWRSEIKKKSVFISVDSSGGCCSHSGSTYQMRLDNHKNLFLIDYEELGLGSDDGELFYEHSMSVNLATGDTLSAYSESRNIKHWSKSANFQPSWRQFKLLSPITSKKTKLHLKINKKWTLKNVSSYDDDFNSWLISNAYTGKNN
jgi:hypothetical protein